MLLLLGITILARLRDTGLMATVNAMILDVGWIAFVLGAGCLVWNRVCLIFCIARCIMGVRPVMGIDLELLAALACPLVMFLFMCFIWLWVHDTMSQSSIWSAQI